MERLRKQTETTEDHTELGEIGMEIITQKINRVLRNNKLPGTVYDGLTLRAQGVQGVSSQVMHITDEEEVLYICGNYFCVWSEHQRKDVVIQRFSQQGNMELLYSLRTTKLNLIASAEITSGCVCRVVIFDREAKKHHQLSIVSTGKPLGMHIISPGQVGLMLFDQTRNPDRPMFSVNLFDVEKETNCMSQERSTKALKLVASNFGDFTMVLCRDTCYELEIDMYNNKMDLSEFDLKRFIDAGEQCIDACFLRDSIKLVVVTNRRRVFFFDGRLLVSKRELMVPIETIVPFEVNEEKPGQEPPTEGESPLRKPGVKYRKLAMPRSVDSSADEIVVLFEDSFVAKFKLQNGKHFKHECSYELPGEPHKDTQVQLIKLINGDLFMQLYRKTPEAWKLRINARLGQENEQLCPKLQAMPYPHSPALHLWDTCSVFKTIYTIHRDRVLRCWHAEQGLKFSKLFFQSPLSMAVHPIGFQLCISFKEFTRLFLLKQDAIDIIYTLKVRNISSVRYSPQGDRLLILDTPTLTIINPYSYETLMSFQVALSNISDMQCYRDVYVVRNDNYLWQFSSTGTKLVEKKVLMYDMYGEANIVYCDGRRLKMYEPVGEAFQNDREVDMEMFLQEGEKITVVKIVEYYGLVFLGTSEGNVIEMLWPISEEPSTYRCKISNSPVLSIRIAESYRQMMCLTAASEIILLDVTQYIEGSITPGVYVFESARRPYDLYDYEVDEQQCRRTILNRDYLLEGFGLSGQRVFDERKAETEEHTANLALIKGEMQYQLSKNATQITSIVDNKKHSYESKVNNEQSEIKDLQEKHNSRMSVLRQQLRMIQDEFQNKKESIGEKFDAELLQLIRRSQELASTMVRQRERLTGIMDELCMRNEEIMKALKQDRADKFEVLMGKYRLLMEAVDQDRRKMAAIQFEEDLQQKLFRERIEADLNQQMEGENARNDKLNASITQNKKEIERFQKRAKIFENDLEDAQQQTKIMEASKEQYQRLLRENAEVLKQREQIINDREEQIKQLLKQNEHVKNFKEIHEYLMQEYTNDTVPNEIRGEQLQEKVRRMNQELLQEIEWRRSAELQVEEAARRIAGLRSQKVAKQKLQHHLQTSVKGFAYQLSSILRYTNPARWNDSLRQLFDERFSRDSLAEQLTKQLMGEQTIQASEEEVQLQKRIDALMREKDELGKRQQKETTIAQFQEKYKEQLFRKYHGENTELVKEFNLLTKEQMMLLQQKELLKHSHSMLEAELAGQSGIIRSLSVTQHRQGLELKLTPFQQHEQDLSTHRRKLPSTDKPSTQPTSRYESSSVWLKGLLKEVEQSKSKMETADIVRAKVKSFVNPELSRLPTSRKLDSPIQPLPTPVDLFNKLSLQNRQIRTKSELIKSVLRRPNEQRQ